ncbi:labd-13Z-ene-9,15,16-triol synthase, chloroplastic [Folsomia candida]|uniref:labd-13Z-ene-9,15,16-triol synthase, chloroplastic n=1 Tax=Folsomia candida TaxID=158441 RepID=UPI000B8FF830|nr:labd-13Z-ene-9,15,16-triol synthase, chloroplastic [Folsomia candida]
MWFWVQLICLIGTLLFFMKWKNYYIYSYPTRIPGPRRFPLFGNLIQLWWAHGGVRKGELFAALHKLGHKFGSVFTINLDSKYFVVVTDWDKELDQFTNNRDDQLRNIDPKLLQKIQKSDLDSILRPVLRRLVAQFRSDMADGVKFVGHSHTLLNSSVMAALCGVAGVEVGSEDVNNLVAKADSVILKSKRQDGDGPESERLAKDEMRQLIQSLTPDSASPDPSLFFLLTQIYHGAWSLLAWAVLYITLHPAIGDQMFTEVLTVTGNDLKEVVVSLKDRKMLPFIVAVTLEVQRLASVRPLVTPPLKSQKAFTLREYEIPKATRLLISLYSLHRNKSLWAYPDSFVPSQQLGDHVPSEGSALRPPQFFLLGLPDPMQDIVNDVLFLFLATIARNFKLVTVPGHLDPETRPVSSPGPILSPKPYNFVVMKRL